MIILIFAMIIQNDVRKNRD